MKKIISIVFLGAMIGTASQTQCISLSEVWNNLWGSIKEHPSRAIAATVMGATLFRFYTKRACANPSRFETQSLKEALQNGNFKEMFNQLWYFIDDVIIGRKGRGSTIKVLSDGKTLDIGPSYNEIGLGGKIHANYKSIAAALAFMATIKTFLSNTNDGIDTWMGREVAKPQE